MQTETTSKRRNFVEALKRDAVALLGKGDKPIKQLAQEWFTAMQTLCQACEPCPIRPLQKPPSARGRSSPKKAGLL